MTPPAKSHKEKKKTQIPQLTQIHRKKHEAARDTGIIISEKRDF